MTDKYQRADIHTLETLANNEPVNSKNGKCARCGNCCTHHLGIFPSEIKRIRQYIKDHNIKPCIKTNKTEAVLDLTCPFLDDSKTERCCTIYEVRPCICKSYLCSEKDNTKNFDTTIKEALANRIITLKEIMEYDGKEQNVQQLFFPDEYTPTLGDIVVINAIYLNAMIQYKEKTFLFTGKTRNNNGITEAYIINNEMNLWFDIKGLAKIRNPKI